MFSQNNAVFLTIVIALFLSIPSHSRGTLNEPEDSADKITAYTFLETANLESIKGNQDAARKAYFEAEKLFRREQDRLGLAQVLLGIGNMESIGGNHDVAKKLYIEAEKLFRQEQYWSGLAKVLHGLAELESRAGNSEESLEIYNELARIHDKINDQYKQSEVEHTPKENSDDNKVESDIASNLSDIFSKRTSTVLLIGVTGALIVIIIYFKPLMRRLKGEEVRSEVERRTTGP